MATTVTVHVSGERVDDLKFTNEALMREVGLLARERIIRRTLSGLDVDGRPFHSYSLGYAKRKADELGVAFPVNLQLSGAMLNAIVITEVTEKTVSLDFSS